MIGKSLLHRPLHTPLRALLVLAICAQVGVLIFMAAKREIILAHGQEVYLRSAPIDPRDPFRGDYVRLHYSLNRIFNNQYQGDTPFLKLKQGDPIFAVLTAQHEGIYSASHYSDTAPGTGTFMKGRITTKRRYQQNWNTHFVDAKFGIEQYFVQQGKGKTMEARLGSRNSLQVPVEMQLALGSDGTAVIRNHRWSRLGIQLNFKRTASAPDSNNPKAPVISPLVEVTFENVSEKVLNFASLSGDCSFSLAETDYKVHREHIDKGCSEEQAGAVEVTSLQPGESQSFDIDLGKPRWHFLNSENVRVEMAQENLWKRYRLRYTAPPVENTWQGFMDTPAFRATGNID